MVSSCFGQNRRCHLWHQLNFQCKKCPLTLSEEIYNFVSTWLLLSTKLAYLKIEVLVILLILCSSNLHFIHIVLQIYLIEIFSKLSLCLCQLQLVYQGFLSLPTDFTACGLSPFDDITSIAQLVYVSVSRNHSPLVFVNFAHSQPVNIQCLWNKNYIK